MENGHLDSFILEVIEKENKDLILLDNNVIYQLTSSYNQKHNEYNNISTINLGLCENQLKINYNISNNSELLILKMEIYEKGLLIPLIEYEVFNIKTKEKLDLNICENSKIEINIPVNIDENNLFKYNSSHDYYNDICYPNTKENNFDIILKDKRSEFTDNNLSLCENNCNYKGYNNNTKKVSCECGVKINFPLVSEIEINKDKLLKNFRDVKNTININIMKCYYALFKKEGIIKNIGNYILGIIIIFTFILSILFKAYGIVNEKEVNKEKKNVKNDISNKNKAKKIKKINIKKKRKVNEKKSKSGNNINKDEKSNNEISSKSHTKLVLKNLELFNNIKDIKTHNNSNWYNGIKNQQNIIAVNNNSIYTNNINDYEMNNLNYKDALIIDKRNYFQYYFSLLKMNHIIIFTFITRNDYNSKAIKIILFLFYFSLNYTINTLFFNDGTIHQIYEDEGNFNFIYQIPQILYSLIITSAINSLIKYLSLTEKKVLDIKKEKLNIIEKKSNTLYSLTIKFILFFIFVFIFLFFFWYYLSCFCAVYINTQIHLIKDTLISFGLSLIYSLVLNLLPGLFRIPSLKNYNRECIYKISKILQLI